MKKSIQLITSLICLAFCGPSAQAATVYWDIDGATVGAGGATPAGTWDTGTTANWTTDPTGASAGTTFTDNDDAVFSAGGDATGAFTVTVSGSPVAAGITLEEGTVTLTGGPIGGTPTVTINSATLMLGSAVLPSGANLVVNSPGLLDMGTLASASCAGLSGNGTVTKTLVGDGATCILTLGNNNATTTFTGSVLNNTGTKMGLIKTGTGTQTLSGLSSLGGGMVINAGKVIARHPQALGSLSCTVNAGTLEIANQVMDGTLQQFFNNGATILASGGTASKLARTSGTSTFPNIGAGAAVTLATATSGDALEFASVKGFTGGNASSVVTMNGPGTVKLSTGSGNYAGSWTVAGGTLQVDNATALGAAARPVTLTGGTLELRVAAGATYSANVTVGGNAAITPTRVDAGVGVTQALGTLSIGAYTLTVAAGINATSGTMGLTFEATTLTGNATFTVNNGASADTVVTLGGIVGEGPGGPFGLTKNGTGQLTLNGVNTYSGDTTIAAGTLALTATGTIGSSANIIVGTAPASTAILDVTAAGITIGSGKTLKGQGTVNGAVTVNGTLSPGASVGTLAFGGDLILAGNLLIDVDKSLSPSPSNDVITVAGTLTNAGTGTVTVTNLGPALAVGDSFQLFNKPVLNGQAMGVVSAGTVVWTNKLAVDGSIAVLSTGAAPSVPATNLTIVAVGPTSFSLGGMGAANSAYDVYASTNVTTPMTNWWLIGTTNSDASGVIQFLDPQATNEQRFYRFGQ